jgi:hypothetical protein
MAAIDLDYYKRYGKEDVNFDDYMSMQNGADFLPEPQSALKSILKKKNDHKPILTPSMQSLASSIKKMDNQLLAALSNSFTDNLRCKIDKRCICLVIGDKPENNAF